MKRFFLVISALCATILGLDKVGIYQFVPGDDTGFHFEHLPNASGYSLGHENGKGKLTAWVDLTVQSSSPVPLDLTSVGWTGSPLAMISQPLGNGQYHLLISKKPAPPQGTPFDWGAGLKFQVIERHAANFEIVDWTVYPKDQSVDSRNLSDRRRRWTEISWGLVLGALLGAGLGAWKEKEAPKPVTAHALVEWITSDIVGNDPTDTKNVQTFLRKVLLENVPASQALTLVGLPNSTTFAAIVQRTAFQARAKSLFKDRIDRVILELNQYSGRL